MCRKRIIKGIEDSGDVECRIKAQKLKETEYCAEVLQKSEERRGAKRLAEEVDDGERLNREEMPDRGVKRMAEREDGPEPKRAEGQSSSSSSQGAPAAGPSPAPAQEEENEQMEINELGEIARD